MADTGAAVRIIDSDRHVVEPPAVDELIAPLVREAVAGKIRTPRVGRYHPIWGDKWFDAPLQEPKPPALHLAHMDEEGVDLAVHFPTELLQIGLVPSAEDAGRAARAYNDWLAGFCSVAPERLKGCAVVAPQDPDAAAKELARCIGDLGFVGVMMPTWVPGLMLSARELDPLYAAAADLDVPVVFHTAVSLEAMPNRFRDVLSTHAAAQPFEMMCAVSSVIMGGVLDRFPELRVGFFESGIGWVPFWMERLDEHFEKLSDEVPHMTMPPSEYIASGRCWFHAEPEERGLVPAIEAIGDEVVLYASDYPHWDCSFPESVTTVTKRDDLSEETKGRFLGANAERFYRLS